MYMKKNEEKAYFDLIREIQMRHINSFDIEVKFEDGRIEHCKVIADRIYYQRTVLCFFKVIDENNWVFLMDSPALKMHINEFPDYITCGDSIKVTWKFIKGGRAKPKQCIEKLSKIVK